MALQTDSSIVTIDTVPLRALRIVVAVADRGSFAAAGRHLDLPRATISRVVAQVEGQAGTRLFRRNTRKVVPTEAGARLIQAARAALATLDTALEPEAATHTNLSGSVRLSVSHAFGRHFVLPALGRFRADHPNVHLEAVLEDRLDDMIDQDIDLSIRLGPIPEGDLVVRRLGAIQAGLFAAPSLLQALDGGVTADNVHQIPAVGFRIPGTGRTMPWPRVASDGSIHAIRPSAVMSTGSIEALADLTRAGHGAALLPLYHVAEDVAAHRLLPVLPDVIVSSIDVHLCFREREFMPARVRAVINHLVAEMSQALRTNE